MQMNKTLRVYDSPGNIPQVELSEGIVELPMTSQEDEN